MFSELPPSSDKVKVHPNLRATFKKLGPLDISKLIKEEKLILGRNEEE